MKQDFERLIVYGKSFSGMAPEVETLLLEVGPRIKPRLGEVTDDFYRQLAGISEATAFIDGRIDTLKTVHVQWLNCLFSGPFDSNYAMHMYQVGSVHVKVKLPVEFMAGAMTLIKNRLIELVGELYGDDPDYAAKVLVAVNSVCGLSLLLMQQSYQEASLAAELEKFLKISGMSRTLFANLANAYRDK